MSTQQLCACPDNTEHEDRTRLSSRPAGCYPISPDCLRSATGCRHQNSDRESGNSGRVALAQWKKVVGGKISGIILAREACSKPASKRLGQDHHYSLGQMPRDSDYE